MLCGLLIVAMIVGYVIVSFDEEREYRRDTNGNISISEWRRNNVRKYEANMRKYSCFSK